MGEHYKEVLTRVHRWALVPNGLEPYGLSDSAWLAPCVAVATILIVQRGRHLWRYSHSTLFVVLRWQLVTGRYWYLFENREKQGVSLIIINYYVVEGQAPGACNTQMPSDLDR
jgi:hypothetical protein